MLRFLEDIDVGPAWLYYGGSETLRSYNIASPRHADEPATLRRLQEELKTRLPRRHRDLLSALPASYTDGDYLFVHAGIRPGVPLAVQARRDLLWIRDEFLLSDADHGKVVVHGHTIAPEPELCRNRIGIDTGAFATDRLTCVVLESASQRILHT
jgi:serine/threonine protein phosphatase 1